VRDGGHAIADATAPATATGDGWALARRADGLVTAAIALHGWRTADIGQASDANACGRESAVPFLTAPLTVPRIAEPAPVLVSLLVLSGAPVDPARLRAGFGVEVRAEGVRIGFPDGTALVV
jgi:hypothetical protein